MAKKGKGIGLGAILLGLLFLLAWKKPPLKIKPVRPPCTFVLNGQTYGYGDLDNDGWITQKDLDLMTSKDVWGKTVDPSNPMLVAADVDGNGKIDMMDYGWVITGVDFPVCRI